MTKVISQNSHKSWTLLYILAFCLIWWAIFAYTRHYLDGADMVENYAWGMEWQWGTNKHPPLFGWITAAWFNVFPTGDAAYYLLNEVNLAVALGFLALAMRRFFTWENVFSAIVLTSLGAQFGPDSGFKYNADMAMLPFVSGFVWSLLHALGGTGRRWFVIAGIFAAAALLTKYYALVLFAAIGIAILITLRPPLIKLIKGAGLTGLTALLLVSPHILWSIQHDWPSLHYMHAAHETLDGAAGGHAYVNAFVGALLFSGVALLAWGGSLIRLPNNHAAKEQQPPKLGLAILGLSLLFTLLTALAEHINPMRSWLIPNLLFLGWALVDLTPAKFNSVMLARRTLSIGFLYLLVSVGVATVLERKYRSYPASPAYALPATIAKDVTEIFRTTYHRPIEFAAGPFPFGYILSFYSPDHPHGLNGVDLPGSPWIDRRALETGTKVMVCGTLRFEEQSDHTCEAAAHSLFGRPDQTRQLTYRVYDPKIKRLGLQRYDVLMWGPHST